ncbi:MAG: T9SS type A sorting domain-containing protein [Chitinophagales bacterium]|nr:T9SS type A sorting domain-containing protein [Chitinophagales bacterium]
MIFYRVLYRTEYNDSTTLVSGALAVPQNPDCTPPLISYQHGTSAKKTNSPSYGSQEANILLIFASLGNVLCAPDYIGLGSSAIPIHPYMHGYSQAHSTINMMRATRQLQDSLNYELNNQVFMFGYSQGGYSTAVAVRYIEEYYSNEFKVTAAMPMSGPYNLAGAQTDFINNSPTYATPGYLPYIIMGYQSVYHDLYDSLSQVFVTPYDSTMPYYFYGGQRTIGFINNQCDPTPLNMFTQQTQDAFFNDPNFPFRVHLNENDLLDWTPQTTMRLYYCTGDEQVWYRNAVIADSVWNLNGAPDVQAMYLTNEDHGGCVDNALIGGYLFFQGLNNYGVEILVAYNAQSNSFEVSILNDDIANYDITWSNGNTGATLSNVVDGISYNVTATHKTKACSNEKTFTKENVLGITQKDISENIKLYPNPASNYVMIDFGNDANEYNISVVDMQGKTVLTFKKDHKGNVMVPIYNLAPGTYQMFVEGIQAYSKTFIVK